VNHLLELGHRRIAHLASNIDGETFRLRRERVDAVIEAAGLEPAARAAAGFTFEEACRGALELIDDPRAPTAVFCDDDILAGGAYLAARERGLRIPDDLSVVGFDDLPFAQVVEPPLTTVAIDPEELGATAFEVLAEMMAGGPPPPGRILPVELIVRDSAARPRN
jgi:DNA-binding LacI/PurR family transcriptional regulator